MANFQNRFFCFLWLALLVPPTSLLAAEPELYRPEIRQYLEDLGVKAVKTREIELLTATDRGGALYVLNLPDGTELQVLQVGLSAKDVFRFYLYDASGDLVGMARAESTYPWDAEKLELDFTKPQPVAAKAVPQGGPEWIDGAVDAAILQKIASGESRSRDISESIIRR